MITGSEQAAPLSLASMVHDLRNPLATIHGSAEMLAGGRLSQLQVRRVARNMCCASVRMRELIEEFLDRSRVVSKEREPSDIRDLVASAVDKISAAAEFQSVHVAMVVPGGVIVAGIGASFVACWSICLSTRWRRCPREELSASQRLPKALQY